MRLNFSNCIGTLPNVFQCVDVWFALRMAQMALVSISFHFSIYYKMSRYGNSCSVSLIINTSVDNYTLRNGREQDTCRYKYRDTIQRK